MANIWTEDDIKKLVALYPEVSNNELSVILNKTVTAIQHKAVRLKIKKSENYLSKIQGDRSRGENNSNWKGGKKTTPGGYIQILNKEHHEADVCGYIFEHRYIMEQVIGRDLTKDEVVHHINGNKQDNRIENLELMLRGEHERLHHLGQKRSEATKSKISKIAKNKRVKRGVFINE